MLKIGILYALRNIFRTPVRSFFTIFSIAMIISMYMILISIANSFTSQITHAIDAGDIDLIIQSKFSATPLSSAISQKYVQKIASDPEIKNIQSVVVGKKRLPDHSIVFVFGFSNFANSAGKLGLTMVNGNFYKPNAHELIIAQRLMKNKHLQIGDSIKLSEGKPYRIRGNYNSWISFFNSSIILDLEDARRVLHKPGKTSMLFLTLRNPAKLQNVMQRINRDYTTLSAVKSRDFTSTMGALKNMFYLSDIIAAIALIVASAILINTFLMAINERSKEIGILNAIGWRSSMIVTIFVIESLALTLFGGIIGLVISYGMLRYIQSAYSDISFYLPQNLDLHLFGYSLLMCVGIAFVSALFPALYASRISIAKALRDG
jgi:putative ABC transport system permease protein